MILPTYNACWNGNNMTERDSIGRFVNGHAFTEETLKKMSEARKGKTPWNKGKIFKPKTATKKGTPEYTTKMSEVARLRQQKLWLDPEYRKKMSDAHKGNAPANKGVPLSEATRQKVSAGVRKAFENPEVIQKLVDSHKGQKSWISGKKMPDEFKQKLSKAHIGIKMPEVHRQKCRTRTGEKASNWKGGISFEPYCSKFNRQLKERIRERDNRTCQLCGIKENGEKLAVHHIHYDKENCKPDLVALCRSCNAKVNTNRDYWESHFMNLLRQRGLLVEKAVG